jgi:phosphohistidine phosphatase
VKVFLVRHGDADAEIPEGLGDEARSLTSKGRQVLRTHLDTLSPHFERVHLLLTSPLVRAVQTAQILASTFKLEAPLRVHRCLLPDMPVGSIETALGEHPGETLVLVGHQPSMGAVAAHLLGLQQFPKPVNPGTVIGLERPDEPGAAAKLLIYAAPGQPILESL